ncbi:MAG: hypothetical protein ABSC16_07880 [Candidatus Dormibacteria bacterium]|jgi:hypothetical protein|nr:hypothetical protein [Chloroflexota bacterium]HBV93424.1 hypothetical protein [Chloroflexota bacterium]
MAAIPAVELLVILALVILIVLGAVIGWERYRGGGAGGPVAGGARPTTEVFIDPETGQRMRVWFDDRTGQREYHPE